MAWTAGDQEKVGVDMSERKMKREGTRRGNEGNKMKQKRGKSKWAHSGGAVTEENYDVKVLSRSFVGEGRDDGDETRLVTV